MTSFFYNVSLINIMENQKQTFSIPSQGPALLGVGDLLKKTWQIYRARLGTFFGITLLPFVIGILLLILGEFEKISNLPLAILFYITLYLITVITSFWSHISLLYAIKERESKIGIKESFKRGWHKVFPFIWISILTGFIGMGGFLLLVIPGIIFLVWFIFSNFVLISEDLKGMDALFRSKQLVNGYWWKVFWRLLVIWLIVFIISTGITLPLKFFVNKTISDIAEGIFSLFLTPFFITYTFLIYENLRKLKGGILFEPPKRGTKIKYILVGVLGFLLIPVILVSIVLTSLRGARSRARDARREADMRQLLVAQEIYYGDNGRYYTSGDRDGTPAIPLYLNALDDPKAPAQHYKWLDNTTCDQKFCAYAVMENSGDCGRGIKRTFAVSERGTKRICGQPPIDGCACWQEEAKPLEKIEKPYIKLISPNGGEIWKLAEDREIKWDSRGVDEIEIFIIDYSYSPEVSVKIGEIPSPGRFWWAVPWDISELNPHWKFGDKFKIKIYEKKPDGTYGLMDESDDYFTIITRTFHLCLLSPNGGERWKTGKSYEIKWESEGIDKIAIEIVNWSSLPGSSATIVKDFPANLGKYLWFIPSDISELYPAWRPGDKFTISILEKQPGGGYKSLDGSDDYFIIY